MKTGILIASQRKKGNCEVLGRFITKTLPEDIRSNLVFLRDFEIKQCNGCMACVFKNEKCRIDDDFYKLMDKILEYDSLILIAPTYVLTIPGKLKMLLDRFLCIYEMVRDKPVRPAISMGVASPIDYFQFQLPFMNLFLLSLGFKIAESFLIFGAGPGEVLLHENIEKVKKVFNRILNFEDKPFKSCISKHCPVDYSTFFEHIEGNKYRCPVCLTPCTLKEGGFYFDEKDLNNHRWTKENLKEHFEEWILKTLPRFKKLLPEIYKKKKELL